MTTPHQSSGHRKRRIAGPSLDLLALYCDFCVNLQRLQVAKLPTSLRRIASGSLGVTPSDLSKRLAALEQAIAEERGYCVTLVERAAGNTEIQLTSEGKRFYAHAARILKDHRQALLGRPTAGEALRVGTTNWIMGNLFADYMGSFVANFTDVEVEFLDYQYYDLLDKLRQGELDLCVGPLPDASQAHPFAKIEPFGPKMSMVVVCPPSHRFAIEANLGSRRDVKLKELEGESLYALPDGVQPGLERPIPPPDLAAGGRSTVVPHYSTVVDFVCMGLGVGVVPERTRRLETLYREGLLYFLPIPELGQVRLAFYRRRRDEPPASTQMVSSIREYVNREYAQSAGPFPWTGIDEQLAFPDDVREYQYLYYVSWSARGCLEWRRTKLLWRSQTGNRLGGIGRDFDHASGRPVDYEIEAIRTDAHLSWTAIECEKKEGKDVYSAAFNCFRPVPFMSSRLFREPPEGEHRAFIGIWTGLDDKGSRISGTALLSNHSVTEAQGNELVRLSHRRLLLSTRRSASRHRV